MNKGVTVSNHLISFSKLDRNRNEWTRFYYVREETAKKIKKAWRSFLQKKRELRASRQVLRFTGAGLTTNCLGLRNHQIWTREDWHFFFIMPFPCACLLLHEKNMLTPSEASSDGFLPEHIQSLLSKGGKSCSCCLFSPSAQVGALVERF